MAPNATAFKPTQGDRVLPYKLSSTHCPQTLMIHLSPPATQELNRLKSKHPPSDTWLRLDVRSGGCSSWSYAMAFVPEPQANDIRVDCEGLQVAIERESLRYLDGLTIDYAEDLMGGGFRFSNPNASQTCSCGNSFAV
jgi:iron-sulfur cluster assembly protein